MKKSNLKGCIILAATALIWGIAFVAQSEGMKNIGVFTFIFCRSILSVAVLLPISLIFGKIKKANYTGESKVEGSYKSKTVLISGCLSGVFLFGATVLQQIGLSRPEMTSGKGAFITALYIVFAPVIGMLFGKKSSLNVWLGVGLGVFGMYLLCMSGVTKIGFADLMIFLCSLLFSGQILVIDFFSMRVDGIKMSCVQFITCTLLSGILMLLTETPDISDILDSIVPILYLGIMSSAVAYTLQIIGQKYADMTPATLTMSLESVFAALSGWIIVNERLSAKELVGCGVILIAIIFAQIPKEAFLRPFAKTRRVK